jgi:hypothetical protein
MSSVRIQIESMAVITEDFFRFFRQILSYLYQMGIKNTFRYTSVIFNLILYKLL